MDRPDLSLLERPLWHALNDGWRAHAEGSARALRLQRDVGVFAAAADASSPALAALAALLPDDGGELWLVERNPPEPPGSVTVRTARCVQMVAERTASAPASDLPIKPLGETDAADMLALADLTRPGPYILGTQRLGAFIGVRDDAGRLIAMAGERMRMGGLAEVSGVCTHPDAQGRGLATLLMRHVIARIVARGERPFLHAYDSNAAAIALYERLGFRLTGTVAVRVVRRADHAI
ncbi:Predicted acetyltransferase, GNAT family [Sphingomonas guangdongensis]|uniref:Predicted acetyltransferase, GNAT family n=1 Tax=Sphingomonas guangdongensis TaxID=1141890 RepID=A0A285QYE1_9SPHN|nr:GNAT family N-acetyltransferase [Sphingomonas guangdongensis]SOB86980.1 Predicted acetyltransferase, GNAT family [Sphingomonas guangdongensis]